MTFLRKDPQNPLFDDGHLLQQIDSQQMGYGSVEVGIDDDPEKRAFIALVHALSRNIPERSFMRSAFKENKKGMKKYSSINLNK